MNYYSLRLRTGEILACGSENSIDTGMLERQTRVVITNPIVFESFKFPDYETGQVVETISMIPYMPISADTEYTMRSDAIITIGSLRDSALERYKKYLAQMQAKIEASLSNQQQTYDEYDDEPPADLFDDLDTSITH